MSIVPRLNLQYPDEGQDPYFATIKSFYESLDSYIFANMADRNLILVGGGIISLNAGTNVVTWGDTIRLIDYASGYSIQVVASSLTIADGEAAVLSISRKLTKDSSAVLAAESVVGVSPDKIVLFARSGSKLYFRNGMILAAGADSEILDAGPSGEVRFGTATFDGVNNFIDVAFATALPDANYRVVGLVADAAFALYAPSAQKLSSGFRIATVDASIPAGSVTADWKVER